MRERLPLVSSLLVLAACPDRPIGAVYPEQATVEQKSWPAVPTKDVDILFVVDNSGSMVEEQASLRANFSKFMDVLGTVEGGIPNLHIGVTTSSLGQRADDGTATGAFGAGCAGSGDDGALRTSTLVNGRFLVDEEDAAGVRFKNYSGTLADAFAELADVGTGGCGIEQHLAAAKRSLVNPVNSGFLRDGAKLAIIFIADEDDCSLAKKALFEGETDGTNVNFRCTREGIECDGGEADLSVPGPRTDCRPKADSAYLADVDAYVDYFKNLKPDADKNVLVAGILGDPDPVAITTDANGRSVLAPSCEYSGQVAYPAVRTAHFLSQFAIGPRETICNGDLSGALVTIAAELKRSLDDRCILGDLADADPAAAGLQPDCSVSDVRRTSDGSETELAVIPACDQSGGAIPCWRIEADPVKCHYTTSKLALVIDRGTGPLPASDIFVKASCTTTAGGGAVQ